MTKADIRTPEVFMSLLHSLSPNEFAEAVADFTDSDRRKLSKLAQEHAKALRKEEREATTLTGVSLDEMVRRSQSRLRRKNVKLAAAHLGLLAVAPKSANIVPLPSGRALAESWSASEPTEYETAAITILLARRPDWAQQWLERQVEIGDWGWSLMWPSVNRLLEDGLCTAPETEAFARMVQLVLHGSDLKENPELAQHLWIQFRFSTGFFHSSGKLEKSTDPKTIARLSGAEWLWHNVHHGNLDRQRVIDESIAALWRDFNNSERSTLGKLIEALDLTDDEFLARQAEFRKLLAHDAPAVVTFALKILKPKCSTAGCDIDGILGDLPLVFAIQTKTQPKSALVLLKSLVGKDKSQMEKGCQIAAQALLHEDQDVQEAAAALLERWSKTTLPIDALQQSLETASPIVRTRIEALLTTAGVHVDAEKVNVDSIDADDQAAELSKAIEDCSPNLRLDLALDDALSAALAGQLLPPTKIDSVPVNLGLLNKVEPLKSAEELIDAVSELIGNLQSPIQIELVLDGISRWGSEYPSGFTERMAPFLSLDGNPNATFHDTFFFPHTIGLILDWTRKKLPKTPSNLSGLNASFDSPDIAKALDLRAGEIRQTFLRPRQPLPLLSLPTHEHGWIAPQVLISRLRQYVDAGQEVCPADLRVGLLRLPANFEFDEADLTELPDQMRRLLQYAGGQVASTRSSDNSSWWLAAGRARNPRGNLSELAELEIPKQAWGIAAAQIDVQPEKSPAAIEHEARERQKEELKSADQNDPRYWTRSASMAWADYGNPSNSERIPVSIEPCGDKVEPLFLTVIMASRTRCSFNHWYDGQLSEWAEQWQATHWPSNTDGSLAIAIVLMLSEMDRNTSSWQPIAPSLRPLLWPERAWSETAIWALWIGLFAKDADVRAVATDALIEGILDGRAHPADLSPVLVKLLQQPWLKPNRLADALAEVVRVSPWAAMVVSEILDAVLSSWVEVPKDAHHLLTVQLAALMEVDGQLTDAAQRPLLELKGSTKTAKLARQLLAIEVQADLAKRKRALFEAVQCRLQRLRQS